MKAHVDEVLRDLSDRIGVPRPDVTFEDRVGFAAADGRAGVIRFGSRFDELPATVQRWLVAHESAHIYVGHRPARVSVVIAAGIAAAVLAAGGVWAAVAVGISPDVVSFLVVGISIAALQLLRLHRLRQERHADRLAAEWGYPLAGEEARRWAVGQKEVPWIPWVMLGVHDRWRRRIRDAEKVLPLSID